MSQERMILIDGSSMLVSCYYGSLPKEYLYEKDPEKRIALQDKIMQTPEGIYANGMYSMTQTILKILREQSPSHMAFAFDRSGHTVRKRQYENYKSNRAKMPSPLREQFRNMCQMLIDMGFMVLLNEDYEADDLIGTASSVFEESIPVYMITKDHDYLQLVSERSHLWLVQPGKKNADALKAKYSDIYQDGDFGKFPDKAIEVTPEICKREYGVRPDQIPDLKGIQGDASDNIPGVKGVSSAAVPLLEHYGSIEEIYRAIDECGSDKETDRLARFWKDELKITRSPLKALIQYREAAFFSKDLATIHRDIPIPGRLEDYRLTLNSDSVMKQLKKFGFKQLAERFQKYFSETGETG